MSPVQEYQHDWIVCDGEPGELHKGALEQLELKGWHVVGQYTKEVSVRVYQTTYTICRKRIQPQHRNEVGRCRT